MKTLKNLVALSALALLPFTVACEKEESGITDHAGKTSIKNIQPKVASNIYDGVGTFDADLKAEVSLLLPKLISGSYQYYTDKVYNFSFNDGTKDHNVILIFMEIIGEADKDLSHYPGDMQEPFSFSLNELINIPGSVALDPDKDVHLIIMHDDELDIDYAINSYFKKPLLGMKIPRKAGMTIISKG